ncbi:MAG: S1 RNA-binding domain-containing protein, partial [Gammaproteobacteria bacterium]|nr:S1 RNA-binding domain-containing protein [Gammaproteobacteria bacterium]
VRNYKKGEEVETTILAVDPERERISLGIKQLDQDPLSSFLAEHPKGSIVKGTVTEVEPRGATIDLGDGIEGQLRASELSRERVEDARTVLKAGDDIEARFIGVDRKARAISLSIKAKEEREEAEAVQSYKSDKAASGGTTLGDLLKEQMGNGEES